MFERAVTARYLHQNPDEAGNFMDYYWVTQEKLARVFDQTFDSGFLDKKNELRFAKTLRK